MILGWMIHGTYMSSLRHFIQGTYRPRDASSKNKFSGTHRSGTDWHCVPRLQYCEILAFGKYDDLRCVARLFCTGEDWSGHCTRSRRRLPPWCWSRWGRSPGSPAPGARLKQEQAFNRKDQKILTIAQGCHHKKILNFTPWIWTRDPCNEQAFCHWPIKARYHKLILFSFRTFKLAGLADLFPELGSSHEQLCGDYMYLALMVQCQKTYYWCRGPGFKSWVWNLLYFHADILGRLKEQKILTIVKYKDGKEINSIYSARFFLFLSILYS
jgi:hypothetical protein